MKISTNRPTVSCYSTAVLFLNLRVAKLTNDVHLLISDHHYHPMIIIIIIICIVIMMTIIIQMLLITSSHSSSWIASHCRSFTVLHSSTCRKFNHSFVLIVLINQYHYDWFYEYMKVFLAKTMLTRRMELNCGFVALSWGQFLEPITVIVDEVLITRSRLVKDLCWWELISSVCITNTNTNTNLLCDTFLVLDFSTNLTNQMV